MPTTGAVRVVRVALGAVLLVAGILSCGCGILSGWSE